MSDVNIFEQASRENLVFVGSKRGAIGVNDLWNLPLSELDEIGRKIHNNIKDESFSLSGKTKSDDLGSLQLELLQYVYNKRTQEHEDKQKQLQQAGQKQFLLSILEKKRSASLENLTEEELLAKINELT